MRFQIEPVHWTKSKNQIFIILVSVPVRCSELAEPVAATCAKAHGHSVRLHH